MSQPIGGSTIQWIHGPDAPVQRTAKSSDQRSKSQGACKNASQISNVLHWDTSYKPTRGANQNPDAFSARQELLDKTNGVSLIIGEKKQRVMEHHKSVDPKRGLKQRTPFATLTDLAQDHMAAKQQRQVLEEGGNLSTLEPQLGKITTKGRCNKRNENSAQLNFQGELTPNEDHTRASNKPKSQRRHASFDCSNLNADPNPLGGKLISMTFVPDTNKAANANDPHSVTYSRQDLIGAMHNATHPIEENLYQKSLAQTCQGAVSNTPLSPHDIRPKPCRRQKLNNQITRIMEHDDVFDIIQQKPIFQGLTAPDEQPNPNQSDNNRDSKSADGCTQPTTQNSRFGERKQYGAGISVGEKRRQRIAGHDQGYGIHLYSTYNLLNHEHPPCKNNHSKKMFHNVWSPPVKECDAVDPEGEDAICGEIFGRNKKKHREQKSRDANNINPGIEEEQAALVHNLTNKGGRKAAPKYDMLYEQATHLDDAATASANPQSDEPQSFIKMWTKQQSLEAEGKDENRKVASGVVCNGIPQRILEKQQQQEQDRLAAQRIAFQNQCFNENRDLPNSYYDSSNFQFSDASITSPTKHGNGKKMIARVQAQQIAQKFTSQFLNNYGQMGEDEIKKTVNRELTGLKIGSESESHSVMQKQMKKDVKQKQQEQIFTNKMAKKQQKAKELNEERDLIQRVKRDIEIERVQKTQLAKAKRNATAKEFISKTNDKRSKANNTGANLNK